MYYEIHHGMVNVTIELWNSPWFGSAPASEWWRHSTWPSCRRLGGSRRRHCRRGSTMWTNWQACRKLLVMGSRFDNNRSDSKGLMEWNGGLHIMRQHITQARSCAHPWRRHTELRMFSTSVWHPHRWWPSPFRGPPFPPNLLVPQPLARTNGAACGCNKVWIECKCHSFFF